MKVRIFIYESYSTGKTISRTLPVESYYDDYYEMTFEHVIEEELSDSNRRFFDAYERQRKAQCEHSSTDRERFNCLA